MSEATNEREDRAFDVGGNSYFGRHIELGGQPLLELSRINMDSMHRLVFLMLPIDPETDIYLVGNFEFDTMEELVAWLTS